jgi:hypothetical protein
MSRKCAPADGRRGHGLAALAVALCLAIGAVSSAHDRPEGGKPVTRPDIDYVKAAIAEAKALDTIGRGGFQSSTAYLPQCVFRYGGCISGCSSAEVACYVVAYPDDEKRTNYTGCVDAARRCRLQCCNLECAKQLKLERDFPCDF